MKLPKIPIDYSKAGSGEAPFDGEFYILHFGDHICDGRFLIDCGSNPEELGPMDGFWESPAPLRNYSFENLNFWQREGDIATHYTPMPEFYEEGGE